MSVQIQSFWSKNRPLLLLIVFAAALAVLLNFSGESHPLNGKSAPSLELAALEGDPVDLASLRGKVVVLDFWATWCPPCRKSIPHVAELAREFAGKAVAVYAVNIMETREEVGGFLKDNGLSDLPVLMDTTGAAAGAYQADSIPQLVVIDQAGTIRRVFRGYSSGTPGDVRALVNDLLASPPQALSAA